MKSAIKLSAIHSYVPKLPETADPKSGDFDPAGPKKFKEANLERTFEFFHEAGRNYSDLVCTREDFMSTGYYLWDLEYHQIFESLAEEIPGPTSQKIGEIAKQYNMYIAANYYEKDGREIFNTSVLIGRTGEVIGKYRKVQLPAVEKWKVCSGNEFPVFETDIGRIGFNICYDLKFPETCRAVALQGADIIIHQTLGWGLLRHNIGEALVRVRAAENNVYMVVAKNITQNRSSKSCIIDVNGNIIAEEAGEVETIVTAEFVPDFDNFSNHFDALFSGVSSIKARTALEREPSVYSILAQENPKVLERFKGTELVRSPERIKEVYRQKKQYDEDIENNRPVKVKYHWER